jgi:phosphoglycolate phosphatase-like HAD superfamily hydrolase
VCLTVGDTIYDVESARKAGVRCVGVTGGGYNDAGRLKEAGAAAVVRDVGELLERLEEFLGRG